MIDPQLFTVDALLVAMLDDHHGNRDVWRQHAEILVDYVPPFRVNDADPKCVVRYGNSFLRYSRGPGQGHFWDMYGEDYLTPSLALMALLQAPVPPSLLKPEAWDPFATDTDAGGEKAGG